jgi:hypothetical protein
MRGISGCTRRLIVEEEELAGVAMAMGLEDAAACKQARGGEEKNQGSRCGSRGLVDGDLPHKNATSSQVTGLDPFGRVMRPK